MLHGTGATSAYAAARPTASSSCSSSVGGSSTGCGAEARRVARGRSGAHACCHAAVALARGRMKRISPTNLTPTTLNGYNCGPLHTQTRHSILAFAALARHMPLVAHPARLRRGLWTPMRLTSVCWRQQSGARSRARRLKIDLFSTAPRGGVRGAVRRGSACVARLRVLPAGRVRLLDRYGPESVDVTARSCRVGTWTADD